MDRVFCECILHISLVVFTHTQLSAPFAITTKHTAHTSKHKLIYYYAHTQRDSAQCVFVYEWYSVAICILVKRRKTTRTLPPFPHPLRRVLHHNNI